MASPWNNQFFGPVTSFHERRLPEPATPVGYAALINRFGLAVPLPRTLSAIGRRHKVYVADGWRLLTPRHAPAATLAGHLGFALRHEPLDLAVLKRLFLVLPQSDLEAMIRATPTGGVARRLWFLYEWLLGRCLDLPDMTRGAYVPVVDPVRQFAIAGVNAPRQRVRNNLPGTPAFCPLVCHTPALDRASHLDLASRARFRDADVRRVVNKDRAIFGHVMRESAHTG